MGSRMEEKIKSDIISIYQLKMLGFDFMGYTFDNVRELSYHHLLVPKRDGGETSMKNGSLLVRKTSHNYIHTIEQYDPEIFKEITELIKREKDNGKLGSKELLGIYDRLKYFENEYHNEKNSKGNYIIKEEYTIKRVKL